MEKVHVKNTVREYPDSGEFGKEATISSHGIYRDRIVLEIDGKLHVFIAGHLIMAIQNATNGH